MGHRTSIHLLMALLPLSCSDQGASPPPPAGTSGSAALGGTSSGGTSAEPPPPPPSTGGSDVTPASGGSTGGTDPVPPETGGAGGATAGTGGGAGSGTIDDPLAGLEEVLVSVNFDERMLGAYTEAMVREDFGEEHDTIKVYEGRAELVRDEELGSNVLRVRYPDGCVGPDACGMQFRVVLERAVEEAWISYKLKFETGFEWVRGGKLPGLCGARCNGGCVGVSGSDGWSARMMWRREGELVQYMYYPGKSSACGDDFSWGLRLETDRWMEVKTHIVMNTPGQNDGLVRSWLDGEEMLSRNIRYRNIEDIQIDRFYFSTFYGGESADWAPSRETFARFDDFVIATVDPAELPSPPEL